MEAVINNINSVNKTLFVNGDENRRKTDGISENIGRKYDYSILNDLEVKGFNEELWNQYRFNCYEIPHKSNPTTPKEWKAKREIGVDHIIRCGKYIIAVEDKAYHDTLFVYPSNVNRDVIPRFEGVECDVRVCLTNDKTRFTRDSEDLLKGHNVRLMNLSDLIAYYCRLLYEQIVSLRKHGYRISKYLCIVNSIIDNVYSLHFAVRFCGSECGVDGGQRDLTEFYGDDSLNVGVQCASICEAV